LRRSLLVRLLLLSVLISIGSIAATAWLAVRTTTGAIRQEQNRALGDDARVYDTLVAYAASHPDWSGVAATVRALADSTGRRITLTSSEQHTTIADSAPGTAAPRTAASAVIDPLAVDPTLDGQAVVDRIDPRAVGPFRLPDAERARLRGVADTAATCVRTVLQLDAKITVSPSGRPVLDLPPEVPGSRCEPELNALAQPTPTEARALTALNVLVDSCLSRQHLPPITLQLDPSWRRWTTAGATEPPRSADAKRVATAVPATVGGCIGASRREQLDPYVAPAALLFVSSPADGARPAGPFDLSQANRWRIAEVTGLVLLAALLITVLAGARLTRPLHALTGAARRMRDGDGSARVPVTGHDEIARLASTFNDMSHRREELEKLRRDLVSDIAHEMRTPVTNIRGWLEAAQDGLAQPDAEFIASLLEEAMLLQHVIDDLQDLAAADAGELRVRPAPVLLGEVIGQVAAANQVRAANGGVALVTRVPEDCELMVDPIRLRQVIGNLVSNAVRHTPAGGEVTIAARRTAERAIIDVADTGAGIAAEDLPYVFDRFWRAEKSRSRQTGGSGLGLPIARKLVEAHGGTLTVTSTPGRGSVFTVTLPLTI
jgi:two-component system sensor histidine kinase BaeS